MASLSCTNDGSSYARARIEIQGEREWAESKAHPGRFNIPMHRSSSPAFDDPNLMKDCAQSYIKYGNISGIRSTFLMAYTIANLPIRSGDVMASYSVPLYDLLVKLGNDQFASSLSKMRPEIQSAVFYILFMSNVDKSPEWASKYPHSAALERSLAHQLWPHDIESR